MSTSHLFSSKTFVVTLALIAFSLCAFGQKSSHEPTSATDGEVKIHDGKRGKSVFQRTSRKKRETEREGAAFESAGKFKPEIRRTERHGKPIARPKQRNRHRNWNMSRVFSRHQQSAAKESPKSRNRSARRRD